MVQWVQCGAEKKWFMKALTSNHSSPNNYNFNAIILLYSILFYSVYKISGKSAELSLEFCGCRVRADLLIMLHVLYVYIHVSVCVDCVSQSWGPGLARYSACVSPVQMASLQAWAGARGVLLPSHPAIAEGRLDRAARLPCDAAFQTNSSLPEEE